MTLPLIALLNDRLPNINLRFIAIGGVLLCESSKHSSSLQ